MKNESVISFSQIKKILGEQKSKFLLDDYKPLTWIDEVAPKYVPSANVIEEVYAHSDRNNRVLNNLAWLYRTGHLAGTGYLSILPVDQGIEHTAIASFSPNPIYFNPENIIKLALEGGCNAVASTFGGLGLFSRKYAHKIPFIVKINHNELMTYPTSYDESLFGSVKRAYNMGAAGIGATIYFGSPESRRQIKEISEAFEQAHEYGMFTVLWCYLRNSAFKTSEKDYHVSADGTAQADHLGVTIHADIIKQKLPENDGAFAAIKGFAKGSKIYDEAMKKAHPIDWARIQTAHAYNGLIPTINSGGAETGKGFEADLQQAVETAVINKRAGGAGLIMGRKAFQKPMNEGVQLINAVQSVYLAKEIKA